jgi:hypothetical protein
MTPVQARLYDAIDAIVDQALAQAETGIAVTVRDGIMSLVRQLDT